MDKVDGNELPSAAYDKYFTPPDEQQDADLREKIAELRDSDRGQCPAQQEVE